MSFIVLFQHLSVVLFVSTLGVIICSVIHKYIPIFLPFSISELHGLFSLFFYSFLFSQFEHLCFLSVPQLSVFLPKFHIVNSIVFCFCKVLSLICCVHFLVVILFWKNFFTPKFLYLSVKLQFLGRFVYSL